VSGISDGQALVRCSSVSHATLVCNSNSRARSSPFMKYLTVLLSGNQIPMPLLSVAPTGVYYVPLRCLRHVSAPCRSIVNILTNIFLSALRTENCTRVTQTILTWQNYDNTTSDMNTTTLTQFYGHRNQVIAYPVIVKIKP
jgi:hypothetical protein